MDMESNNINILDLNNDCLLEIFSWLSTTEQLSLAVVSQRLLFFEVFQLSNRNNNQFEFYNTAEALSKVKVSFETFYNILKVIFEYARKFHLQTKFARLMFSMELFTQFGNCITIESIWCSYAAKEHLEDETECFTEMLSPVYCNYVIQVITFDIIKKMKNLKDIIIEYDPYLRQFEVLDSSTKHQIHIDHLIYEFIPDESLPKFREAEKISNKAEIEKVLEELNGKSILHIAKTCEHLENFTFYGRFKFLYGINDRTLRGMSQFCCNLQSFMFHMPESVIDMKVFSKFPKLKLLNIVVSPWRSNYVIKTRKRKISGSIFMRQILNYEQLSIHLRQQINTLNNLNKICFYVANNILTKEQLSNNILWSKTFPLK